MQIKLIAMDLDGTLMLPDHQRVGETTRRALAACRQQGVRLALATGRTLALTEEGLLLADGGGSIVAALGSLTDQIQARRGAVGSARTCWTTCSASLRIFPAAMRQRLSPEAIRRCRYHA